MTSVIIVAAGIGKRMGTTVAKQYLTLRDKPILYYTLNAFEQIEMIDRIIVVTGKADIDYVQNEIINKYNIKKAEKPIAGGSERQYSVYNGLMALNPLTDIVLIHDGVRPFVKKEDIKNLIAQTRKNKACLLGVKVKDTIKICDENGFISDTPNRNMLWQAQTPQAFSYDLITEAHKKAQKEGFLGTDDAMLVERLGYKIKMVEGSYTNIKITTPEDLQTGEVILDNIQKSIH